MWHNQPVQQSEQEQSRKENVGNKYKQQVHGTLQGYKNNNNNNSNNTITMTNLKKKKLYIYVGKSCIMKKCTTSWLESKRYSTAK